MYIVSTLSHLRIEKLGSKCNIFMLLTLVFLKKVYWKCRLPFWHCQLQCVHSWWQFFEFFLTLPVFLPNFFFYMWMFFVYARIEMLATFLAIWAPCWFCTGIFFEILDEIIPAVSAPIYVISSKRFSAPTTFGVSGWLFMKTSAPKLSFSV